VPGTIAFGVPFDLSRHTGEGFDLLPLATSIAAILVARYALGMALTRRTVVTAALAGVVYALSVDAWGFAVPSALAAIAVAALAVVVARPAR
jgi:hypothetical protein